MVLPVVRFFELAFRCDMREVLGTEAKAGSIAIDEEPMTIDEFTADTELRRMTVVLIRAARAPLEAELTKLLEQLAKATEMNQRQAKDIGDLEAFLCKDGTAFLYTGASPTVEAVRRIEELKAQLAQQKPAAASIISELRRKRAMAIVNVDTDRQDLLTEVIDMIEKMGAQKPAAPAGLPKVGEPVEINRHGEWITDRVQRHTFWGGKPAFEPEKFASILPLEKEGDEWRRIPPAQTSREPTESPPTAAPDGVTMENLLTANSEWWHLRSKDRTLAAMLVQVEMDIRANLARERAVDKARIAELEAVKRQMGIECEGRHKAEAEVARLTGELERAKTDSFSYSSSFERMRSNVWELQESRRTVTVEQALEVLKVNGWELGAKIIVAPIPKRCPADGMSDYRIGCELQLMFAETDKWENFAVKARELFTPVADKDGT